MQRGLVQTQVYYNLSYSVWEETSHKPLKVATTKKCFPSVYTIDITCLGECFLFHVMIERHYFLYKFIVTKRFDETTMLLRSLKQVLPTEVRLLYPQWHNDTANTKGPQQSFYFLRLLIVFCYSFSLWMLYIIKLESSKAF